MARLPIDCPKCGKSNTLEPVGERQGGFSGGKAAAGMILLGGIGLVGGLLGKKKVQYQCTNCGYIIEK